MEIHNLRQIIIDALKQQNGLHAAVCGIQAAADQTVKAVESTAKCSDAYYAHCTSRHKLLLTYLLVLQVEVLVCLWALS